MSNTSERHYKLALVVDDSVMQCKVLSVLLKEEGYRVYTANDGARGVDMYIKYQPDLVLMDINMPIMNGYEAARQIKSLSKNTLAPLIFITSMDTEQAYIESIEAGGDGILVRPFSPEVFKAKIKSIQRISDLYAQVKSLQLEQQKDAELAEQLMSGVIESRNFSLDRIGIVKKAAALFSGDIQLTAQCPNGDVNVLLGDFTGHGLRSSIGAIPLAETFRVMTRKGFSLFEIISQINNQLYDLLPADLFLCASFINVSSHDATAYVFNAGLPDTYVYSQEGEIKHKIASSHPPIGVLKELLPDSNLEAIPVALTDRIILISDGIIEARNEDGEMYGIERLENAAKKGVLNRQVSEEIMQDVETFCEGTLQEDDISLIDIPCNNWETSISISQPTLSNEAIRYDEPEQTGAIWSWNIRLVGEKLAKVNPVPMAMSYLHEVEGSGEQWQNLYTILTELFVNALDHGVLGLSSDLKKGAEGFALYFREREARLSDLNSGAVELSLSFYRSKSGGRVVINVTDTGKGFDSHALLEKMTVQESTSDEVALSGRGILLISQLCDRLEYKDDGTSVTAEYLVN